MMPCYNKSSMIIYARKELIYEEDEKLYGKIVDIYDDVFFTIPATGTSC